MNCINLDLEPRGTGLTFNMSRIILYANVNPLMPECFIEVLDSTTIGTTNSSIKWNYIREKGNELKAKGFKVYIIEEITTKYEL